MSQNPTVATSPTHAISPLIQRLAVQYGAIWCENREALAARTGYMVLFIAGDPVRFPEALDVAVVLPEIQTHFRSTSRDFQIVIAEPQSEDTLANAYGVQKRPALVLLRDAQYLGSTSGMLDWDVFIQEFSDILHRPVSRPPSVGIPVRSASPHCH